MVRRTRHPWIARAAALLALGSLAGPLGCGAAGDDDVDAAADADGIDGEDIDDVPSEAGDDGGGDGPVGCGNGVVEAGEICDDGNRVAGDGCELDCTWTCESADDDCPPEEHCEDDTHTCEPGCRNDDGCADPAPLCDVEAHACVECLLDDDCDAGRVCIDGACVDGCNETRPCADGLECCGGGCVDPATSLSHCGGCDRVCETANATPACVAGSCEVGACDAGYADCDGSAADGCEVGIDGDPANCGACGVGCESGPRGTAVCAGGICSLECADGWGDCNGDAVDGCETDLAITPTHCGACDTACVTPNALPACRDGACAIGLCYAGWADCNDALDDGCETSIADDIANCGACGTVCGDPPHGTAGCAAGACAVGACEAGWGDCDGSAANGCETDTTSSVAHCGACGAACVFDHAAAGCTAGTCVLGTCETTWADCNGLVADGCEIDTATDSDHCGGCGAACPAPPHATAACSGGGCGVAICDSGWGDCDGVTSNGCETTTGTDPTNCGACGRVCTAPPHATAGCSGGVCGVGGCDLGWADCNAGAADGCEAELAVDPANCGVCGTACPALPHAVPVCAGSICGFACDTGWADCNSIAADGCEANTATDPANCGACGRACGAGETCSSGSCVPAMITPGRTDIVVARDGWSVTCLSWSGRICTRMRMRMDCSVCPTYTSCGVWHDVTPFNNGEQRTSRNWCAIATGNSTVVSEGSTGTSVAPRGCGWSATTHPICTATKATYWAGLGIPTNLGLNLEETYCRSTATLLTVDCAGW